jgi:hypothetical protein
VRGFLTWKISVCEFASLDTMVRLDTEAAATLLNISKVFVAGHKWRRMWRICVCHACIVMSMTRKWFSAKSEKLFMATTGMKCYSLIVSQCISWHQSPSISTIVSWFWRMTSGSVEFIATTSPDHFAVKCKTISSRLTLHGLWNPYYPTSWCKPNIGPLSYPWFTVFLETLEIASPRRIRPDRFHDRTIRFHSCTSCFSLKFRLDEDNCRNSRINDLTIQLSL